MDKVNLEDAVRNRQSSKAGDVITVQDDNWPWGTEELVNPDWRIVKIPGVAKATLLDLLEPDAVVTATDRVIVRRRRKYINISGTFAQTLISGGQVITLNTAALRNNFTALRSVKAAVGIVVIG